jgi:hypothetical protein
MDANTLNSVYISKGLFFLLSIFWISVSSTEDQDEIRTYYEHISLAKRSTFDRDFPKALDHYDRAFLAKKDAFYCDITNAVRIANHLNDSVRLQKYLALLMQKGRETYLTIDTSITKRYTFSQPYLKKESQRARAELLEIFRLDQSIRPQDSAIFRTCQMEKSIDSMDRINFYRFQKMIARHSFPTENSIGYQLDTLTLWDVINTFCIHWSLGGFEIQVDSMLNSEFKKGNIPNGMYAAVLDRIADSSKKMKDILVEHRYMCIIGGKEYYSPYRRDKKLSDLVNTNRKRIGLDSLHTSQKYFLWQRYCSQIIPDFTFEPYAIVEHLPGAIFEEKVNPGIVRINVAKINCN